jgi:hypothetical protein
MIPSAINSALVDGEEDTIEKSSAHCAWQAASLPQEGMSLEFHPRVHMFTRGNVILSANNIKKCGSHGTPQNMESSRTVEARSAGSLPSAKPFPSTVPDDARAEYDLNLMKVYRYQIAPWVSVPNSRL